MCLILRAHLETLALMGLLARRGPQGIKDHLEQQGSVDPLDIKYVLTEIAGSSNHQENTDINSKCLKFTLFQLDLI